MKILVAIKRVPDFKATIRVKADGSGVETAQVKMVMNPFDEIAMEEALRLKEKGQVKEVIAVSIGTDAVQETLRSALAMGADRAILVQTGLEIQPLVAAKILQAIIVKEMPQLIILGKQAVDTDHNQTGQMLAGLLHWPQGTFVSAVVLEGNHVQVTREIDGGLETLVLQLPAVITTDLRLNVPRYLSLPSIMQAKRRPLDIVALDTLPVNLVSGLKLLKMVVPEKRRAQIHVANCLELVRRLKEEAKVLS